MLYHDSAISKWLTCNSAQYLNSTNGYGLSFLYIPTILVSIK